MLSPTELVLSDISVPLSFRSSPKARRLALRFDAQAMGLVLVLPSSASRAQGVAFALGQEAWIRRQLSRAQEVRQAFPPLRYQPGDTLLFLGEPLILELDWMNPLRSRKRLRPCRIEGGCLKVRIPQGSGLAEIRKRIHAFYKDKASQIIHERLEELGTFYGSTYRRVSFRDQKTRWGSCSAQGNLNFNWRLAMAPIEIVDYVVAHELCHLRHMNHSKAFWAWVEKAIPDHKEARAWLRKNEAMLRR